MIITRTPLRISFVGGGTDLPFYYKKKLCGSVICITPKLYIEVVLRERHTSDIGLNEKSYKNVDEIPNPIIREALRYTGVTAGIYLMTLSDVPVNGSGLGASSAVLVGILNALYHYQGIKKTPAELAKIACEIEMDILQLSSGKQDAYACALGGLNHLVFYGNGHVDHDSLDTPYNIECERGLDYLLQRLMLFFTGYQRQSDNILKAVTDMQKMDVLSQIQSLVGRFSKAVGARSVEAGEILHLNWEMKKRLATTVSNPKLDAIYDTARQSGAVGGKLLGAGGGGFFLFYVEPEQQADVRKALELQEFPLELSSEGTEVILANGKSILSYQK